jgi:hypothetical protein
VLDSTIFYPAVPHCQNKEVLRNTTSFFLSNPAVCDSVNALPHHLAATDLRVHHAHYEEESLYSTINEHITC